MAQTLRAGRARCGRKQARPETNSWLEALSFRRHFELYPLDLRNTA